MGRGVEQSLVGWGYFPAPGVPGRQWLKAMEMSCFWCGQIPSGSMAEDGKGRPPPHSLMRFTARMRTTSVLL